MVAETWQPNALNFTASTPTLSPSLFSAQKSDDGKTIVFRYVNFPNNDPNNVTISFGSTAADSRGQATIWSYSSADAGAANPPGQPDLVAPVKKTAPFASGSSVEVEANSYTIVEVKM